MGIKAVYYQRGESIDYINPGKETIPAGEIIKIGANRVGITGCDILPADFVGPPAGGQKGVGSLHVMGVFFIPKADADTEFKIGDDVFYTDEGAADAGDVKMGWAVADSAVGEATVLVSLGQ